MSVRGKLFLCGLFSTRLCTLAVLVATWPVIAHVTDTAPAPEVMLTPEETAWLAAHPVIRLAPGRAYPPIQSMTSDGRHVGISADYVALIEEKLGIHFTLAPRGGWDAVLHQLHDKRVDLVSTCMDTPDRREWALFTRPYLSLRNVIIVRKGGPEHLKLGDLHRLKVNAVAGHAVYDFLRAREVAVSPVPDFRTGLREVSFGSSDAMVGDVAVASYLIQKDGITNLRIAGDADYNYQLAFACRNDWPELISILDKGLALITPAERKAIWDKWVRLEEDSILASRRFWLAVGSAVIAAGLIVVGVVAWNRSLQHQVRARTHQLQRELAERRQLEEGLRHAQKMEIMGTLASGIAHDLNNLLTIISGFTGLARGRLATSHAAQEPLRTVEQAVNNASGMTRSLLTLSRKAAAIKTPVDLGEVVRDSLRLVRLVLPASIEIRESLAGPTPVFVNADVGQLQQVLLNLATNARDAMPEGGCIEIRLQVGSPIGPEANGSREKLATLTVQDTGTGIPPEVMERVFDPFFTTKPYGKGTGLGLAMAQAIVREHEGDIRIDSGPGQGTQVIIRLPMCEPQACKPGPGPSTTGPSGQGRCVLLAEDSPQVRSVIVRALERAAYRVTEIGSGDEAAARILAEPLSCDLAVLDVDLPGMDGVQVARRAHGVRPELPIILMSGNAEVEVAQNGRLRFLRKPFPMSQLVELAGQMLEEPQGARSQ